MSPARTVADLRPRARALYDMVTARSSGLPEQLALIVSLARTVAASEGDVRAVREVIVGGVVRECRR